VLEEGAQGRDLLVSAQTGSGKTVAFGLAMAEQLLKDGRLEPTRLPLGLVIAPTRELALQVSRELEWLYTKGGGRIATCVGGMDPRASGGRCPTARTSWWGTPGRLRDHLERGALDLSALRVAVLDEADEMLDMGFREDLEGSRRRPRPSGARSCFSATIPKPIVALAKRYQRDAVRISTVGEDRGHGDISYQAVAVSPAEIEHSVINLLRFHEADTAMLFCATRDNVRRLHASLVERGFAAVALSGEHSQSERNHALQALRDRRARVCVATDVAGARHRPAEPEPRHPCRIAARCGRLCSTVRADRARGQEGHGDPDRPLPAPQAGGRRAAGRAHCGGVDTRADRRGHQVRDRERLLETLLTAGRGRRRGSRAGRHAAGPAQPAGSRRGLGACAPGSLAGARGVARPGGRAAGRRAWPGSARGLRGYDLVRINVGRRHNADPRWLLPLLCRRGHITKNEVGAIRIAANETAFQIPRAAAGRFAKAVERTAGEQDDGIAIEAMASGPSDAPRPPAARVAAPRHKAKPYRKAHGSGWCSRRRGPRLRRGGCRAHAV
jgi:ATP-dependent RNA helicase DeaD